MKLKVCGMKFPENITQVTELHPDFLGFIFYEKSSRFCTNEIPSLPKKIKKVGVFVNASIEYVLDKINHYNLDYVQLHGNETIDYCNELRLRYSEFISKSHFDESLKQVRVDKKIKIIKVFSIKDEFDFSVLSQYEEVCDYFLFDTKGALPGGNGYAFNWAILENYPSTKPYFLSGGIGLENLTHLQEFISSSAAKYCYAIDVNSKFEEAPGLKNITNLTKFKNEFYST